MRGQRNRPQMSKGQLEQGILALNQQMNHALQAIAEDMMRLSSVVGGVCDHLDLLNRSNCPKCEFEILHPTVGDLPSPEKFPKCFASLTDEEE